MDLILLDAGGPALIFVAYGLLIFFLILHILVEAIIMKVVKYNFGWKTLKDAFVVNLVSLGMGFALMEAWEDLFDFNKAWGMTYRLFILFIITIIIELPLLFLLNRHKKFSKTLLTCVLMNFVTYLILFIILITMGRND